MTVDAVYLLQLTLNGIALGLLYALIAVGLSLIFGVMEIINFAHGEFLMLGAYAMTFALPVLGLLYWPALAGASAVAARDAHIRIEFFFNQRHADGTEAPRRRLKLFSLALSCGFFAVMAALFARWVWDQYRFTETSMGLGVPLWWYGVIIPPLALAIAVRFFVAWWRARRQTPTSP